MDLTVENMCGLLIRSKLLTPDDVKSTYQRWLNDNKGQAGELEPFLKWLVSKRTITEYQASLLRRGHVESCWVQQYKILERIGKGRMAGVYKAVHRLGQVVAIKILPPSKAKDPQLIGRFQREARLALRLRHPNIVRTFQMGQQNDLNFIVMEYLEGETLDEVLNRRGKLPINEAVRLMHQALMGLQHIHEQGLVHRDMKPANLMLVPGMHPGQPDNTLNATVKILDIGLGKALFDESLNARDDLQLTSEGVLLGTPDYLAPEQARNAQTADVRADIYSLGCVLFHLLTGQPPFPDANVLNQMVRHMTEPPRPLKEFLPGAPDGLQQILNWMMAKDPAQRYPTPERAGQALQVFIAAGTQELYSPESDPSMSSYLTWLEVEGGEKKAAEPPTVSVEAVVVPNPPAPTPAVPKPVAPVGSASAVNRSVKGAVPASAAAPAVPAPSAGSSSGVQRRARPAVPAAPSTNPQPPVTVPLGPVPAAAVPAAPTSGTNLHKRKQKEKDQTLPATPVAQNEGFDVELVAAPQQSTGDEEFHFTRRDFVMFGAGVGGTLLAVLGAIGLSKLASRKEPPVEENKPAPRTEPTTTPEKD